MWCLYWIVLPVQWVFFVFFFFLVLCCVCINNRVFMTVWLSRVCWFGLLSLQIGLNVINLFNQNKIKILNFALSFGNCALRVIVLQQTQSRGFDSWTLFLKTSFTSETLSVLYCVASRGQVYKFAVMWRYNETTEQRYFSN